jgi:hypothetical protein
MKIYRYLAVLGCLFVLPLLLTSLIVGKDTKKKIKNDVCLASNLASICAAANTCGSASSPCSIDSQEKRPNMMSLFTTRYECHPKRLSPAI